jgi:hypothetical protein
MKQIDTNTEVLTGVGQGDNEILIAANYYDGRSKRAAASARVSVRLKETMSEAAVEAMTQSDLEEIGKVGYQLMMSAMIKSGDSSVRITPHSITKSKLAGYLAIRTDYQEIHPTVTRHTTIYVLHLGDRLVKLTLGYDSPQAFNLRPTINEIINSFQINGRSNYAATQAVQAAQCQPRQPTPQER